jgi:hypothetical protein
MIIIENGPPQRAVCVRCRCRFFGPEALSELPHHHRDSGSVGRASERRPAADPVLGPEFGSVGRVGFGSSCCFLSWERRTNGPDSPGVPKKEKSNYDYPPLFGDGEDIFAFAVLAKSRTSLI